MTDDLQTGPPSLARIFGGRNGLAWALAIDIVLPFIAVRVLERAGASSVAAFALAALFPFASTVFAWIRHRRVEAIGLFVLMAMAGGIAMSLATNDARFSVFKAAPAYGLFGVLCLASLGTRRPLMFHVSRYFTADGDAAKAVQFEALLARPGFARSMRFLTLVWGLAALGECALGIASAFLLPLHVALVGEPALGLGTVAVLLLWTAAYARRRQAKEA